MLQNLLSGKLDHIRTGPYSCNRIQYQNVFDLKSQQVMRLV